ncbi:MAG TPA: ATP-binding protein [Sphingomonas sp.]|uniref:ATP-binding protein n=1 Tax=Sphingomonas sp. TaxID=28214 RepID=UPI002ED97F66
MVEIEPDSEKSIRELIVNGRQVANDTALKFGDTSLMTRLLVPDSSEDYVSFSSTLAALPDCEAVEFDFGQAKFATPGWMIVVGGALRQFRSDRPDVKRRATNYKHLGYAAHAGFFQFFGLSFGKLPAAAPSSERFIPIQNVVADSIREQATDEMKHHGDVIQNASEDLVEVLLQARKGDAFDTLAYSIREIIRNVIEHSGSEDYAYAAQYWPALGKAEIAIADRGIGLASSLSSNPNFRDVDDLSALDLATRPGVSSKNWRNQRSKGVWANSGFGLYMVKGLCLKSGGAFSLISGSQSAAWTRRGSSNGLTSTAGTTVIMNIDSNNINDLTDHLAELRTDAGQRKEGITEPSPASMSLKPGRGPE